MKLEAHNDERVALEITKLCIEHGQLKSDGQTAEEYANNILKFAETLYNDFSGK